MFALCAILITMSMIGNVSKTDNASQYQPRQVRNAHFTGSGTSSGTLPL